MNIHAYLTFDGRCEEALTFYATALGAKTEFLLRFKDSPEPMPPGMLPPGLGNKVMHASFRIGNTMLMADDGGLCQREDGQPYGSSFSGFSLSIVPNDQDEAKRSFAALADGGTVKMPLGKTFWSPCFGMLTDRFGVAWMISVEEAKS